MELWVLSIMNNLQKAEQWHLFLGCFKSTGHVRGLGITALLWHMGTSIQNHMCSPTCEQELMWRPATAEQDMLEADEKPMWVNVPVKTVCHWLKSWCKSKHAHKCIQHARTHARTHPSIKFLHYRWEKMKWGGRVKTNSNHPCSQSVSWPLAPIPWCGAQT